MPICGIGLGLPYGGTGVDRDALSYFNRAGISSNALTPSAYQNASTFNGSNQQLTVADNTSLRLNSTDFSFSCWVNPNSITGNHTIFGKAPNASNGAEYIFQISTGSGARFAFNVSGTWYTSIASAVSTGVWTHFVFVVSGSNLTIYKNGVSSATWTLPVGVGTSTSTASFGATNSQEFFNGSIGQSVLWKRALTSGEVSTMYNNGSGITYANSTFLHTSMISWWDLSETSGNRADSFGSNTLTNSTSVGTTLGPIVASRANSRALILEFIKELKDLGFWNSMVCWPLRSSQNAGTGTTAYSLGGLGTFNGTLTNGPTWGTSGVQSGGGNGSARINIPLSIRTSINVGATLYGVATNASDDNYAIFNVADGVDGTPTYPLLLINQSSNPGVVPVVTRNGTRYFHSTRGGAFPEGFSSVASVIRATSQANFRNATLIANETSLNPMNPDSYVTVDTAAIAQRGNGLITGGGVICPFVFVSSQTFTDSQVTTLNTLYKTTLGVGLGLP